MLRPGEKTEHMRLLLRLLYHVQCSQSYPLVRFSSRAVIQLHHVSMIKF